MTSPEATASSPPFSVLALAAARVRLSLRTSRAVRWIFVMDHRDQGLGYRIWCGTAEIQRPAIACRAGDSPARAACGVLLPGAAGACMVRRNARLPEETSMFQGSL